MLSQRVNLNFGFFKGLFIWRLILLLFSYFLPSGLSGILEVKIKINVNYKYDKILFLYLKLKIL